MFASSRVWGGRRNLSFKCELLFYVRKCVVALMSKTAYTVVS